MTERSNNLWLVWKRPENALEGFHPSYKDHGVYPQGELMGICPTEEDADRLINYLEEFSPSAKFGEYEDERKNSMEDAPYIFTKTNREMNEF